MRALSERIAACEESCRCVDTFVERFKDLAAKVQEGFADARGKVARRTDIKHHVNQEAVPSTRQGRSFENTTYEDFLVSWKEVN